MKSFHRRRAMLGAVALLGAAALVAACANDDSGKTSAAAAVKGATTTKATPIVLNGEGNNLDAYSMAAGGTFANHRVDTTRAEDPKGWDINAQLCVFERNGKRLLIAGEDTGQPDPPPGWGIFELNGKGLDDLTVTRVAKLTPTFQPSGDDPENYGCGVLDDGRILTTDVGQQATGDDGQLIIWFPPYDGVAEGEISYCKLDVALPTAQSILVTGANTFLVAAARGGIYQFTGPFPTDSTPAGGCDGKDSTGRPMATSVHKATLLPAIAANGMATPAGLAAAPDGGFYASSVFTGVINEYSGYGTLRRTILPAPPGESIGARSLSTGTPLGLVTDAEGNLWYADIGLVLDPVSGMGPGDHTGSLRVIRFAKGEPQPPQTVAAGLDFPDGLGTMVPG